MMNALRHFGICIERGRMNVCHTAQQRDDHRGIYDYITLPGQCRRPPPSPAQHSAAGLQLHQLQRPPHAPLSAWPENLSSHSSAVPFSEQASLPRMLAMGFPAQRGRQEMARLASGGSSGLHARYRAIFRKLGAGWARIRRLCPSRWAELPRLRLQLAALHEYLVELHRLPYGPELAWLVRMLSRRSINLA